jgi:2-dehydro-3-deoxygalactonokinase
MSEYLIGCDWGTTGFRLRLTDTHRGAVVASLRDKEGIATMNGHYLKFIENQSMTDSATHRKNYFLKKIQLSVAELSHRSGINLNHIPIIISGMASSNIGMQLLDYAQIPFSMDGSDAYVKSVSGMTENPVYLISGVATASDVMRGEETQLLGLFQMLKNQTDEVDQLFILPGTHAKHVKVQAGKITDLKTYVTGELFEILCKYSVLQYSVATQSTSFYPQAFESGFRDAQSVPMLNALFHVRTNQLLKKLSPEQNAAYLSGVVIGNELLGLRNFNGKVLVAAVAELYNHYNLAMEISGHKNWSIIDSDTIESAAFAGQSIIFNLLQQGNFS